MDTIVTFLIVLVWLFYSSVVLGWWIDFCYDNNDSWWGGFPLGMTGFFFWPLLPIVVLFFLHEQGYL